MNKLVVLIVLLAVGWFFREPLEGLWEQAKGVVPRVQTEMDMRGYKDGLIAHIDRRGSPPEDLAHWLDENNPPKSPDQLSSNDRYGNPYQITRDRERNIHVLRSCGADGQCYTEDDITVDLVAD